MSAVILAAVDAIARVFGAKTTGRTASVDFGPSPARQYAYYLASYSDLELVTRDRDELLAEVRQRIDAERRAALRVQQRAEALTRTRTESTKRRKAGVR
jgi:hypothetical protein